MQPDAERNCVAIIDLSDKGDITIDVPHGDFVNRGSTVMVLNGTILIYAVNVRFETFVQVMFNRSYSSVVSLTAT